MFNSASQEVFLRQVQPALARGQGWEGEMMGSSPNGPRFPLWLRADGVWDRQGHLEMGLGFLWDFTRHKQLEEELRQSQSRYLAILEDQTELVCRSGPDGALTFVNEAYCRYFGKSRDELLGHAFLPAFPGEDGLVLANARFRELAGDEPGDMATLAAWAGLALPGAQQRRLLLEGWCQADQGARLPLEVAAFPGGTRHFEASFQALEEGGHLLLLEETTALHRERQRLAEAQELFHKAGPICLTLSTLPEGRVLGRSTTPS